MRPAFWDASALVPLCVFQQPSQRAQELFRQYEVAVWWATSVEMRSALERLLRLGQITPVHHAVAVSKLGKLRKSWLELQPTATLRTDAESFLARYPLKAADALQLAAAWTWCLGDPGSCTFISGDAQLLDAARQLGFRTVLSS